MNPADSTPSGSSNCGAVVVTYHPDDAFEVRLGMIIRECSRVIVVDNSADPAVGHALALACRRFGCGLRVNASNLGLAAALNRGFDELHRESCQWAVAFDQDSSPGPGMLAALQMCAAGTCPTSSMAIVGANWTDEARPSRPSRHLRAHPACRLMFQRVPAIQDLQDVTCVITSGTLFHLPTWRALGGFDESLFLDLVDTEFCLRARKRGHRVAVAARARLQHRRGAKRPVRFLWMTVWPAFMPPERLYGLFRNRVLLWRSHLWTAPHWALFELVHAIKVSAEIVLLEDRKLAKLEGCLRGTWAGLRGRRGIVSFAPRRMGPPGHRSG